MADLAARLITYTEYIDGVSRDFEGRLLDQVRIYSLACRPRSAGTINLGRSSIVYDKRARDLGSPGVIFTHWQSSDIDSLPPATAPVGPWGEIVILGKWYP